MIVSMGLIVKSDSNRRIEPLPTRATARFKTENLQFIVGVRRGEST